MSVVAATKTENKKPQPNVYVRIARNLGIVFGVLAVLALVAGGITALSKPSDEQKAEQFGTACYNEARSQFKNPESAQLTDTGVTVVEETKDSTSYELSGTGSGMNGFGGYSTVTWECSGNYNNVTEQTYVNAFVDND